MPRTAPTEPLPDRLPPMLLRPGLPPASARDQWALELKWDGMRALFRVACDGSWCLRSRPGRKCAVQFPELATVAEALHGCDVLLDGELVCLDADDPATLIVFDLLHLDGRAVRALPYYRRRKFLERTLAATRRWWRVPAPLNGALDAVLEVTREHELEGIVAKRLDAPYEPGRRSGAWLKHKHRRQETLAVTGSRPAPQHARRPDAIFVARATPDGSRLPAGSAEPGLNGQQRDRLRAALEHRHLETRRGAHRVAAGIWVDVDFHGTRSGPLRDAVMRAVRVDG